MAERIAGKYEVVRELGSGSAGQVFLVKHPDLNVHFALKVLHNAMSDDPRFVEQFKREAEVLLKFYHEGCVQLRDFGRLDSGRYYMATDFCEGRTLRELLVKEGKLEPVPALRILQQLLTVLSAAHERGIIHQDVKPENLMLERDFKGRLTVKVLDFGIARVLGMDTPDEDDYGSTGTPGYMSPEQATGEKNLDGRTDIYSAGIVLYEMLTGKLPFHGETIVQTLIAHITQPPEPFAERCNLPVELEQLALKALEKSKQNRYADAKSYLAEVKKTLARLERGDTSSEPAAAPGMVDTGGTTKAPPVSAKAETKILLLDDEPTLLNLMKHILEAEGYTVFTASNCSSIHSYLFNEDVKLLITDVQMPDIPGWKVCKMLKESLPKLKIILFSNIPERDLEKFGQESKADSWVSKNSKPGEWLPAIRKVLDAA